MPIPPRYRSLFGAHLQPGESLQSAANADLWLRYRRLALTADRLICVERGGLRRPRGGQVVQSIALSQIAAVEVRRSRIQTTITLRRTDGTSVSYALPTISKGTAPFCAALVRAAGSG